MKVSKAKSAENRAALLAAASDLLKEQGFDGAGVAEISRRAGLTQGAFYSQFPSKAALAAEACRASVAGSLAFWRGIQGGAPADVSGYLDAYLSADHLENVITGCPMAAYGSEIGRQDGALKAAFTEGFEGLVQVMQETLSLKLPADLARQRALLLVSGMAGGLAMARAVATSNPRLASEILQSTREGLMQLASAEGTTTGGD